MAQAGKQEARSAASDAKVPRARPGGRAAAVVAAIRKATFELLAERGYDAIEIPDIALRAGVNRTTVYRRWPSKAELLLDIMLGEMEAKVPAPDTGSLQGDLAELLASIARVLADPVIRSVFHILTVGSGVDGTAAKARTAFWNERFAASGVIVSRAIVRGEVPKGASARAILEIGGALLFYRMLVLDEPVDDQMAGDIAAWVIRQDLKGFPSPAIASV